MNKKNTETTVEKNTEEITDVIINIKSWADNILILSFKMFFLRYKHKEILRNASSSDVKTGH